LVASRLIGQLRNPANLIFFSGILLEFGEENNRSIPQQLLGAPSLPMGCDYLGGVRRFCEDWDNVC
jgi:hypothetical protein